MREELGMQFRDAAVEISQVDEGALPEGTLVAIYQEGEDIGTFFIVPNGDLWHCDHYSGKTSVWRKITDDIDAKRT